MTFDLDPALTEAEVAYIKAALADAAGWASAQGLRVPAFIVVAYRDAERLRVKRAEWEGVDPSVFRGADLSCDNCAESVYGGMFVHITPALTDELRFPTRASGRSMLAHEFFHVLQYEALGKEKGHRANTTAPDQVRLNGPAWLGEGSAQWAAFQVVAARRQLLWTTAIEVATGRARDDAVALDAMEAPAGFRTANSPWDTALIAVDQLMGDRPPAVILRYYSLIEQGRTWQDAFAQAFGVSIGDFYARFAAFRAALPSPRTAATISGTLTGPGGTSLPAGSTVCASVVDDPQSCLRATVAGNTFTIQVPLGIYVVAVLLPNSIGSAFRYYRPDGSTRDRASATRLDARTEDATGLTVVVQ